MFNRPRCRDWSPLATQQLRLRNLIQISGHNIVAEPKSSIYYTLHATAMSSPIFTSERMELHSNIIWPEINCPRIVKSSSQSICIRVWKSAQRNASTLNNTNTISKFPIGRRPSVNEKTSALKMLQLASMIDDNQGHGADSAIAGDKKSSDQLLFFWGVYFSGLVPVTKRTDVKLHPNALVFHIRGGFFTSAEYLLPESIPRQANYFFFDYAIQLQQQCQQQLQISQSAPVSPSNCDQIGLSRNGSESGGVYITVKKANQRRSDFVSPEFQNSMANKPSANIIIEHEAMRNGRQSPVTTSLANTDGIFCIPISRTRCPPTTASPTASPKSYTLGNSEIERLTEPHILKIRFSQQAFYKIEIRPSYTVEKLLLLQEKQRRYRYKCDISKEAIDKICMRSAYCLNLQLIANKTLLYRPPTRGNPSMGRTLNRLLSPQIEQMKPEDLLKAQELRRKIETARFRCRLLTQERDHHKLNLRQLRTRIGRVNDDNIDNESWLMENVRGLSRDRDLAAEQKSDYERHQQRLDSVTAQLTRRRKELLHQLKDIYTIECDPKRRFYKINGIFLPNADTFGDFAVQSQTTAANISVALGYVAHIVRLCSAILNIPLRNNVIYKGSASKMRDDVKVLPEHDREFPLFCRSLPPPDSFLYAVFLLNQNIAQIKFMLGLHGPRDDIRATLPNLMSIINMAQTPAGTTHVTEDGSKSAGPSVSGSTSSRPSHALDVTDSQTNLASVSNSSVDLNVPVPIRKPIQRGNHSFSDGELNVPDIRSYRAGGCYADDAPTRRRHRSNGGRSMFYSEPILSMGQD